MKIKFLIVLSLLPALLVAQIQTPFKQRTSIFSPEKKIYRVQGDYTMIGNTNLTLSSTSLNGDNNNDIPNSNNTLKYVDVDNDANTFNSSTAALTFSQEYGANPNCTEVVYAGLYWTGRTNDNNLNTNITEDIIIGDRQTLGGLTCNVEKIAGDWTSSSGLPTFLYTLITESSDTLRITVQKRDNNRYHVTDGSTGITQYDCAGTNYAGAIGTGNKNYAFVHLNTPIVWENYVIDIIRFYSSNEATMRLYSGVQCTKNLGDYPKNKIKIKHANANEYRTIEASPNDIYMDQMGDFIYVSYAEVTEYVQQYGLGNYTVADLVTNKGNGGSLGYLGCWGMVVVYENSNMRWRDITLFDGYASLHQDFYELEIPIEGFRTVQVGRVNMKLGMMAAEGDRNMAGDSCFIQKQSDHSWFPLIHDGVDSLSNFFNSSIQTGGNYRYPNYVNNTGIDIIVMDVPNDNNQIITNEQTSTAFKFTTRPRYVEAGDHEQYHPFCFVMGVDAYVPDAEAISGVMHLDTTVFWDDEAGYYTIPPGSIVEFEVSVKNFGTEDILDAKLEIPLPNTIEYYDTEVLYTYPGVTADFYFDAERNANGTAGWNINYLWSGDPNQVYVKVKLICKVTEDCYVLASTDEDCLLALHVNGTLEGTSYVNNVYFKKGSFISGFRDGECAGDAIRNDILVVVDKEGWIAENCDVNIDYTHREINICGNIFMDEDPATIDAIPFMEIYDLYPQGSRFFHSETNEEYTMETGFPIPELFGEVILVQSSSIYSAECSSELMLNNFIDNDGFIDEENLINTSSVTYCLGEDARPLSELITIENPDKYYVRFYRDNSGSAPAELDIIPNTNELGTVTYYVRQFLKNTIGCEDSQYYPITITVVSPITLSADQPLPTCYGEEVNITATPAGGTFSYSEELEDHIEVNGNVLTIKTTMPAGSVFITYTHNNIVDNTTGCEISQLTYEHQIAQPTIPGLLSQDGTICEGSQIFPLEITEHTGHIERWEWTTTYPQAETTVWNIIPNNTTIITSEDLGNLSAGNYYFRALIKDGNCAPDWTNTIHIEVLSAPAPDPLTFVSPQYACIGTEYEIQVPDETVTYHWYSKPIGGWPDDDLRNVTVTNSWVTRYVSVVSSNENECESIRSEIVVRSNVDPGIISSAGQFVCEIGSDPVTIGSQPTDDRDGQAHVFPSGTVEYQWYVTTTNENGTTSTELISGATSETFTPTDYMSQEGVFIFTRKVRAEGCDDWQQSDGSWRLSIGNPDATISTSPTSILPCNPSVETPITLTAVGPGTKYSYKWYYNDVEITGSVSQTIQVTNPGEYKVQVTHKNSGCVATTTIPISIVIDTQGPNVENGETIIFCSKEDARNVTIYETVEEIEAGLGISIMDNIVDDNLLTLALTDSIVTANPTDVCYKIERTYTVTDDCNNSDTLTHTIKVIDTEKPVITTTAVSGDQGCNPTIVAPTFTGTDNCAGDISASIEVETTGIVEEGCKRTQTWTANYTDACGNAADEVSVTYTWIEDMEAPMLNDVWPTLPAQNSCFANRDTTGLYSNEAVKALYTDCTEITVSSSNTTIGNNCGWTVTRTYTITDACDNSVTRTMSVSGSDQTAPALTGTWPENITGQNNCFANAVTSGLLSNEAVKALYTDNCDGELTVESSDEETGNECEWTVTRTYTITDACGKTSTNSMSVSGSDQTAPALTGTWPENITGQDNCFANADISGLYTDAQVKDLYNDCNEFTVSHTDANTLTSDCGWTITRTYTITDACDNSVTRTMSVSGSDQTAPALTGTWPENITGQNNCFANAVTSGLYTDAQVKELYSDCSTITVTHTDANTSTADCGWTITRTYTIKDACGNTVSPAPTMSVSGSDQTVPALAGTWPANITGQDNCLANANISGLLSNEAVKALYSDCTEITVTHTDANTLTSDCGWTITRTYTIKDACNNTVTPAPIMSVSGSDQSAPALTGTWPENITGQNNCFADADISELLSDDDVKALYSDCSTITVTHADANTLTDNCGWTITRTYTIKDACNNSVTRTMSVSGSDQTAPALTGTWPENITGQNNCFANAVTSGLLSNEAVKALYTDNCDGELIVESSDEETGNECEWTVTRTYTIKDSCGNIVSPAPTMSVSGSDRSAPVLAEGATWPANITGQDNCLANANISGLLSNEAVKALYTDNCDGELTVESSDEETGNECEWTVTRTYTITDACGKTSTNSMSVSGSDQSAPALTGTWPENITGQNNCFADAVTSALYTDAQVKELYSDCSTITVTHEDANTLTADCGWTITRTYTIKDACNNTVTPAPTMSVSGSDVTAPALKVADSWPANIEGQENCFADADISELLSDDDVKALYSDCSTITVTHSDANTSTDNCGWTVTRTYTITDACGNSVTNTMSVSGSDKTAPVIESINLNRTLTSTNCVFTIPDMREDVRNISTDCSEITVTQPSAGMEVYPMVAERDTTVNVIVTDICGNSSVKEVIITIPAKVTISAMATPAVICNGETSQLSATATNVVGTAVYAWAPATELSSATIANPTVTLTASGAAATTTYTVHVTDDNGCTATATASVTVNPEVVMNSVAGWTLCVGETSPEYIFESEITDGAITYGWHNNTPAIGLAAMDEGNLPSFVAANATPANLIAEVKAAPTYTNNGISCQGDSVTFYITVRPSILTPGNVEFSCPRDTTVMLAYNECEQFVNIGYPEFVNNMTDMDVVITNDAPTDFIFTEGTTIVTWTATDECGATLECYQNINVVFPPCGTPNDSVADFDGYRYSSVRIGCQCWTGENARSEHYSDGTPVDNFRYYNDSDSLENIYGKLYTWYAAMGVPEGDNNAEPSITTDPLGRPYVQGICPEGWALPTIEEYMLMIANSGDATHAKDGSNLYWLPGNEGQPPFSGFDAYGAGTYNGALNRYEGLLGTTYFWTTLNVPGAETTTTVEINYYCAEGLQTELNKGDGASIRCLRKE